MSCNRDWSCSPTSEKQVAFRPQHSNRNFNYALSPYPLLWTHCNTNECLTKTDLEDYDDEATTTADNEKPLTNLDIQTYAVTWGNIPGGCSPEFHNVNVIYAECYLVPIEATEHPPNMD